MMSLERNFRTSMRTFLAFKIMTRHSNVFGEGLQAGFEIGISPKILSSKNPKTEIEC
jgi:hypothetical protein